MTHSTNSIHYEETEKYIPFIYPTSLKETAEKTVEETAEEPVAEPAEEDDEVIIVDADVIIIEE